MAKSAREIKVKTEGPALLLPSLTSGRADFCRQETATKMRDRKGVRGGERPVLPSTATKAGEQVKRAICWLPVHFNREENSTSVIALEGEIGETNVMANPWDPPPFPNKADTDDSATFAGVGRVLTEWELVEFVLGTIYSIFRGDQTLKLVFEYGALGEVFSRRYPRLKAESDSYFVRYPNQSIERQFYKLLELAIGYSGQRNDVAHGFVFAVQQTRYFKVRLGKFSPHTNQWLLVQPAYALKKHIGTDRPAYAYSSTELNALAKNLSELSTELQNFRHVLAGDTSPEDW